MKRILYEINYKLYPIEVKTCYQILVIFSAQLKTEMQNIDICHIHKVMRALL